MSLLAGKKPSVYRIIIIGLIIALLLGVVYLNIGRLPVFIKNLSKIQPVYKIAKDVNKTIHSVVVTENKNNTEAISKMFKDVPNITLVYRMTVKPPFIDFFFCQALRSASLYWSPYLGDIGIIFDKESEKDHELAKRLSRHQEAMGLRFKFEYETSLKNVDGYGQQLYSTFIMDEFFDTEILALTDTDAKFTTPITLDNIFTGKKLKVKGIHTEFRKGGYFVPWRNSLKTLLGFPMVADFMSYFPTFLWKDTIANCRNHILKHTKNKNMAEALAKLNRNLSPISVILSYAFHFEKDRYDWHIDIREDTLDKYNKKFRQTGLKLLPSDITADLHMQIHDDHYCRPGIANLVNKQAYCRAIRDTHITPDTEIIKMCEQFKNLTPWILFEFEWNHLAIVEHRTTWCKDKFEFCQNMIVKHYKKIDEYVRLGIFDLDLKHVKAVDTAAVEQGVKCKPFWDDYLQ